VLKYFLSFRIFEQLALALRNRVCPEFTVLKYFLSFRIFEQLALALKNRLCPENFQAEAAAAHPPPASHAYATIVLAKFVDTIYVLFYTHSPYSLLYNVSL